MSTSKTIRVAILSNRDFDAPVHTNLESLTFGRTGYKATSLAFCESKTKDVDHDKRPDLVCDFTTSLAGFIVGDTVGVLRGSRLDGTAFQAMDYVRVSQ